jgi:hypothetical protein
MTDFDPEKFEEKYEYYFEEIEKAYSDAYQQLHGEYNSEILRAVDRHVLSESEPVYEGSGEFRIVLPDDMEARAQSLPGDDESFNTVLAEFTAEIEDGLHRIFEFDE